MPRTAKKPPVQESTSAASATPSGSTQSSCDKRALLRKEEAISLVTSAMTVLQVGYVDRALLRAYAKQILRFQEGRFYRFEDPIDEIVDDFVWLAE